MSILKANEGMLHSMGKIAGAVMGGAQAYDRTIASDVARYSAIAGMGAAGLWGTADPGGMGGMRGAIGVAGLTGAGLASGGAWGNKSVTHPLDRAFGAIADGIRHDLGGFPLESEASQFSRGFISKWGHGYGYTSGMIKGLKATTSTLRGK